jgi:DNA-binding GntR family transcriptional regulator
VPLLTDDDIAHLDHLVERQAEAVDDDRIDDFFALNSEFHELFVRVSENAPLQDMHRQLMGHMGRYRLPSLALRGTMRNSLAEHRAIARACRARDPARAEQLLRDHIRVPQHRLEATSSEEVVLAP